jgi:phage tail tape-measure protein
MPTAVAAAEEVGTKDSPMNSVADAMRDAAATATEHAAKVRETVSEVGPVALRSLSKLTYTSAYVASYGVTYAAVFLANALPAENAFSRGVADGARAAKDALEVK